MKKTSEIKAIKDLTTEELEEVIDSIGDEYEDFSTFAIERLAEKFVSKQGKVLEVGTIWYVSGYELNEGTEFDNTQYCVISNNRYVSVTNEQIFTTSDRFLAFTGTKEEAQMVAKKFGGEVYDFEKVVVKSNAKIGKDGGEIEFESTLIIKQEKGEAIMKMEEIEKVEEIMEDFPDTELSESQKAKIESMEAKIKELKIEEVLRENDARFFMLGSNFEEVAKGTYLAGLEFKLEDAILLLLGSDDEVYYMAVSDLSKLSSDIKYFKNKVLDREGTLDSEFDKVELDFPSEKLDFSDSSYDDVCLIEITR